MATIENVKLEISASGTKADHSVIAYTYDLCPDEQDCAAQREFTVSVGLWGEDVFDDDVLATEMDQHRVKAGGSGRCQTIKAQRRFEVETKILDEDVFGDDEVFLVVEAVCGEDRCSGKSNTVVGDF